MKDYLKRFMIALLMALCVSLLMIGGGLAQSKSGKKQSLAERSYLQEMTEALHTGKAVSQQSF
ncbi:hypothetical protein [Pseudobacillus badius]|uniref:hypothetical protein n=1 Tax=Bacillus badius TaxID=1455 RepID=UPI0007B093F4|nr:hypothetical protein [Bacillus badius]KZN98937.1 hypothetical protein A4244_07510 [Bacillus badius]MED0664868.1 hypothetical protein [Bacillus badius]OCS83873.1 hypothetical protein A6M11_07520 [Bacillus badius]OVE52835.1 hypothetical protein B1A98_04345 [Bacillus badius]TDW04859.1 hypothetical protein B0G66_102292 [Bacillus badius]